jgi:hypothetical protein
MGDTTRPIGEEASEYFWFEPPPSRVMTPAGAVRIPGDHAWPEHHPALEYSAALIEESILRVTLPFGRTRDFDLPQLPTDTWETLTDDSGDRIPLRINIHGGRVAGQWLVDPPPFS